MELFPDMNPAEVLSRVPGVNISRSRGEGKYVYLRGSEPRFTKRFREWAGARHYPSRVADARPRRDLR
jgi:hypothetical protein